VEGVVDIGNEIVGRSLAHRLHQGAVTPHRLDLLDHVCEGRDHTVTEFALLQVDSLLKPCELQQQRTADRDQTGQNEEADALSGHGCKFRGIPTGGVPDGGKGNSRA